MDARQQITRGVLWLGSASLVSQLVDAGSIVVVLWYLDRAEIAVATLAWSVAVLMEAFNGLGVATSIVQAKSLNERQLSTLYWYVMAIAVVGAAVTIAAAPLIADFYGAPELTPMIRVSSVKLLFVGAALVPLQLLVRQLQFRHVGAATTIATLLNNLLKIGLAMAGCGAWSLVLSHTAHGLFVLVAVSVLSGFKPQRVFDFADIREQVRFGWKVAGSSVLSHFYRNVDYLLMGRLATKEVLGLYRVAFDIAMGPAKALLDVVNGSALPVMSRVADDRTKLAEAFLWVTRTLSLVLAPICTIVFFAADSLLQVAVRPEWQGAAPAVRLLCIAAFVRSLAQSFPRMFQAAGNATWALYEAAGTLVVISVSLYFFLTQMGDAYGERAACFAWLAAYPLILVGLLTLARRLVPLSPIAYFRQWLPGLTGALFMSLPLVALWQLAPRLTPAVQLASILIVGVGSYLLFVRYALGVQLPGIPAARPRGAQNTPREQP